MNKSPTVSVRFSMLKGLPTLLQRLPFVKRPLKVGSGEEFLGIGIRHSCNMVIVILVGIIGNYRKFMHNGVGNFSDYWDPKVEYVAHGSELQSTFHNFCSFPTLSAQWAAWWQRSAVKIPVKAWIFILACYVNGESEIFQIVMSRWGALVVAVLMGKKVSVQYPEMATFFTLFHLCVAFESIWPQLWS